MKRRNTTISSKDSSLIKVPFPRNSYGAPPPAARSESQANPEDDSSVLSRRGAQAHNSNGPKTSEYAFFKKLKTDSGQNFHPQPVHDEYKSKMFPPKDFRRVHFADEAGIATRMSTVGEGDNTLKNSSGDFGCSSPVKNFTGMDWESCSSPIYNRTTKNSNLYLKKSNTDSSQKFHPQSIHEKDYRPKRSASNECWRDDTGIARKTSTIDEGDNAVRNSSRDFRSPLPVKEINMDFDPFSSPVDYKAAKNSSTTMKKSFSSLEDMCNIEKWIEKDCDDRKSGGCHSGQVDIFTRKRQNLLQFVSNCSVPEIDKLCSKGNDVVSILLSRLFPSSNEKNHCENPESWSDVNTKSKFLSPPKLDVHFKELDQIHEGNFRGVEYTPSLEYGLSSLWSDVLTEDMSSSSYSSFCYADNNFRQSNLGVSRRHRGGMDTISCVEIKSPFTLPIAEYGSPPLLGLPLKELDDFHDINGSLFERETPALLLEWDFKNTTDENNLAITCHNTDLMRDFSVLNSEYVQEDLTSEFKSFGARELCASSVLANHPRTSYALLPFHSASNQQHDFEEYGLEEREEKPIDFNHLPLTLSHSARYPYLTEDCNDETMVKGSYNFVSSERHHWSMSKVSYEEHGSPGNETSISNELGFGPLRSPTRGHYTSPCRVLELPPKDTSSSDLFTEYEDWKSLDDSSYIRNLNHFSRDVTDIHVRPSFYFQLSLNEARTCPLLLDNSHWEESRRGTHYDDNEMEFF